MFVSLFPNLEKKKKIAVIPYEEFLTQVIRMINNMYFIICINPISLFGIILFLLNLHPYIFKKKIKNFTYPLYSYPKVLT